ncbi:hypothetical protein AMECASPLE_023369 [Ameca splendens]|uniref:Secreted protein n=1 Tax=Ameca splendens TaxID=208324 RepID=A0ABV0ZPA1_9TELE
MSPPGWGPGWAWGAWVLAAVTGEPLKKCLFVCRWWCRMSNSRNAENIHFEGGESILPLGSGCLQQRGDHGTLH